MKKRKNMKINIEFNQYGQSIFLGEEYRFLDRILGDFLRENQVFNSVEEMNVQFGLSHQEKLSQEIEIAQEKWLNQTLPFTRFTKNRSSVSVGKRFLGKNNDEKITLENIFFELSEVFKLLEIKKKAQDDFQSEKLLKLLPFLEKNFKENQHSLNQKYKEIQRQEAIHLAQADREKRKQNPAPAKRLIRDIRLSYHFENEAIPSLRFFSPYEQKWCDKILEKLREKKFKLPDYDHLYISVSERWETALQHATRGQNWFVYGICVLENPKEYAQKTDAEKEKIVFNLIKNGLLDIAKIDNLDTKTLNEVFEEIKI